MSRKLTTYTQPSLTERLATAPNIDELARLWHALGRNYALGRIDADNKTVQRWVAACWMRVEELIATADTPNEACYVFNHTLRWPKPVGMHQRLTETLSHTVQSLPNDAQRLKAQGIIIEGITSCRTT